MLALEVVDDGFDSLDVFWVFGVEALVPLGDLDLKRECEHGEPVRIDRETPRTEKTSIDRIWLAHEGGETTAYEDCCRCQCPAASCEEVR